MQGNATVTFKFKEPKFHWSPRPQKISPSSSDDLADSSSSKEVKLHHYNNWVRKIYLPPDKILQLRKEDGCHEFVLHRELFERFEKSYAYGIDVKAVVYEKGTGEEQEALKSSDIHRESSLFDFLESPTYYYPYLPYTGKVRINGTRIINKCIKMFFSS